jgi:curved DNA-binding protein CbpA
MDAKRDKPERHPDRTDLPDHYAALQVDASATQQEIARAYRALMRNLHPDVDGGRPGGAEAAQPGPGQSGSAQPGSAQDKAAQPGTAQDNTAQDKTAQPGKAQDNTAQDNAARNNALLRIMQAFAVLRDPARRAAYDQSRASPQAVSRRQAAGPQSIPVRYVRSRESQPRPAIRITPVRWESGPWT